MRLISAQISNFRNISQAEMRLGEKNFLIGLNAQGKTNVLEAINYLSLGGSFRGAQDQWTIKSGEISARIESRLMTDTGEERAVILFFERDELSVNKKFRLDGRASSRAEVMGKAVTVLFAPDEVSLIRLQPSTRRALMNKTIAQISPVYWTDLSSYNKALKQRNQLLTLIKQRRAKVDELSGWDDRLSAIGSRLINRRQVFVDEINKNLGRIFSGLSGYTQRKLRLAYKTEAGIIGPDLYIARLIKNRDADIAAGHTTFGPHRDDLMFLINDQDVRHLVSQGEFRLIVLSLKLAEGKYLQESLGEKPVYLLDDVFSELDDDKIQRVVDNLGDAQAIITTTDPTLPDRAERATVFRVEDGKVREAQGELA